MTPMQGQGAGERRALQAAGVCRANGSVATEGDGTSGWGRSSDVASTTPHGPAPPAPGKPTTQCQRRSPHTYHTLHLLRDIAVLITVGSLHGRLQLAPTLGTELQVGSQGAAAALVPADKMHLSHCHNLGPKGNIS